MGLELLDSNLPGRTAVPSVVSVYSIGWGDAFAKKYMFLYTKRLSDVLSCKGRGRAWS